MSRQRTQLLLISAFLVLLGLIATVAWFNGWLTPAPAARAFADPGAATQAKLTGLTAESSIRENLQDSLQTRLGTPVGLLAWYQQADREQSTAAISAETMLASDQLQYAVWLIEQDRRHDFQSWWNDFQKNFFATNGLILSSRSLQADRTLVQVAADSQGTWPPTLQALRVLGLAYARWPSRNLDQVERQLSDRLLTLWNQGMTADTAMAIPTTAPSLDPAATPTPKPTGQATPTPASPQPAQPLLRLDSLDLLTLQNLAGLDSRWQTIYEQSLQRVEGAYLGDNLPLYALGWLPDSQGYLMFAGDQPVVNTEAAVAVILHLAEVGKVQPRSLVWLKEQLFNDRALYESYHLAQAQPTSSVECLPAYAMIARIARITGDEVLYNKAVERLAWHLATSSTSSVRNLIFREDEAGLIRVFAHDNLWALLAFE